MTEEEYQAVMRPLMEQFSAEQFQEIGHLVVRTLLTSETPFVQCGLYDHRRVVAVVDVFGEIVGKVPREGGGMIETYRVHS